MLLSVRVDFHPATFFLFLATQWPSSTRPWQPALAHLAHRWPATQPHRPERMSGPLHRSCCGEEMCDASALLLCALGLPVAQPESAANTVGGALGRSLRLAYLSGLGKVACVCPVRGMPGCRVLFVQHAEIGDCRPGRIGILPTVARPAHTAHPDGADSVPFSSGTICTICK